MIFALIVITVSEIRYQFTASIRATTLKAANASYIFQYIMFPCLCPFVSIDVHSSM